MKVTTKGQVTIPLAVREQMGIYPGSEVDFHVEGDTIKVIPVEKALKYEHKLSARLRGQGTVKMSTDEIMALTRGER
jgi:AbrB family looped-hinge helix DNA binding protein